MTIKFIHNRKTVLEYTVANLSDPIVPKKHDQLDIDGQNMVIVDFSAFQDLVVFKVETCEK